MNEDFMDCTLPLRWYTSYAHGTPAVKSPAAVQFLFVFKFYSFQIRFSFYSDLTNFKLTINGLLTIFLLKNNSANSSF